MSYPSNRGNEFNNITQEKLDSMSTAELLELLESINETMTEDNFDDELITACLDALDRKSPMPEYPSTERAWRSFKDKVELDKRASGGDSGTAANRPKRRAKRALRTGLVAAIIVFCLFSCMLAAQAAGVDVFGSIARWTDSVFGFSSTVSDFSTTTYKRIEQWIPEVPDGFSVTQTNIYEDKATGYLECVINYSNGEKFITFSVIEAPNDDSSFYEKDATDLITIEIVNCPFYVFNNNGNSTSAWRIDNLEYGITTNMTRDELISYLIESYENGG